MNIKIKGVDIEITNAIRDYAEKKVYEALQKFSYTLGEKIFVEIELSKISKHHIHGNVYKASARIKGLEKNIFVLEIKDDLYSSIDGLKDKIEKSASDIKEKKKTLSRKLAFKFKNLFKRE